MRDEQRSDLHQSIIELLPHLRAFAVLLTHDRALADDLVQEAVMRALAHADQFQPGTNFKAWITTILRNAYFTVLRGGAREAPMSAVSPLDEPTFRRLPEAQREALLLVGASGFTYETAAEIAGCAVGTMKSRVARGRIQLSHLLEGNEMGANADL